MDRFEERFREVMKSLSEQSSAHDHSSTIKTDFPAYRELTNLGLSALPYLRRIVGDDKAPRWEVLLAIRDIIQDSGESFLYPSEMAGRLERLEDFTKGYLDCRLSRSH